MAVVLVNTVDFNANTPATADDVIVQDITTVDVTTGVDQQGDYYDSLDVVRGFMHDLGASGSPVRCNAKKLRLRHGGSAWITADDNNTTGQMDDYLIDLMGSKTAYLATATDTIVDSKWHRGHLRADANVNFTVVCEGSMIFEPNGSISTGPGVLLKLTAETGNGNALPKLKATGGRIESDKTITDVLIENGEFRQRTKPATYVTVGPGGVCKYWHTAGTIIEVLKGGHLDLREKIAERTITYIIIRKGGMLDGYVAAQHVGTLIDER
jgi:hypothetical protein